MKKYLILVRTKIDEYLAYRINFIFWRIRNVFNLILIYFLWLNVYQNTSIVSGYTEAGIFTYIFIANILNAVVLSGKTDQVAGDILSGAIINQLLKPYSFFGMVLTREVADKIMNIAFSLVEISLFLLILRPEIILQTNPEGWIFLIVFTLLALALSFLISLSLSFIAFWSTEIWAPRFIFMILISLAAGTLFPLDILPEPLYNAFMLTPFPYLVYVPAQAYLLGYTSQTVQFLGIGFIWTALFYGVCVLLWKKGMREFSFFGR